MDTISIAIAGFSAVSALLLLLIYACFIDVPGKSAQSVFWGGMLLTGLAVVQICQLLYFMGGPPPLDLFVYRLALFVLPTSFYFFGRWALQPTQPLCPMALFHLLPLVLLFVAPIEIALPVLLLFGAGYSLWLGYFVYGLRAQRRQFRFEFGYFLLMSVTAVIVLALGFALPYMNPAFFYHFYTSAIGLALAIMIVALISNPNLIGDLSEAARVRYGASTLRGIDVDACLKKLNEVMVVAKAYQNESLSLASLAEQVGLSGHQLSELVNTRLGMGFSRYVRECRIEAAKALLVSSPSQSILSISIDTGFRSQSAFYAAFKEVTGQSPGDYRKARASASASPH
ncbi:AraC family transcriptional regulator [Steroidobacter sp. S1-65]|uniref:AraC family transcriptional regulator n=1 Tax=Steroidobacter gossypii TaxID=2805490 RepID=A0ABS1X5Q1_9GAMM|nr:helix-turn-helix domain-containing protein [Steroidobacter gossypii]MBM0108535.1 AraC family transcriptional regulator [Steroidobacter gossypii]